MYPDKPQLGPFNDSHESLTFHRLPDGMPVCEHGVPFDTTCRECRAPTPGASKPTNPKDAVGIRKAPLSTVPANVLAELGVAMLEGAAKYGRHNYRTAGVRASVYYDGVMRHLMAWWEGEDIDPDSGLSHITKAIASLTVLRDAMMQAMWEDDRPPSSVPFYPNLNVRAGEVLDRYADRNPRHFTIADTGMKL